MVSMLLVQYSDYFLLLTEEWVDTFSEYEYSATDPQIDRYLC